MSSPPEPKAYPIDVTYRDDGPVSATIKTRRWDGNASYGQTYTFRLEAGIAQLITVEGDSDTYNVPGNEDTREIAAEKIAALPFVDDVVMFDG